VVTEEGQPVVFARHNWQNRELCKRLPLDEPCPTGLLPGHDVIVMDRAYLDVQKDRETLARDVATGSEVQISPHRRMEYRRRMFGRPATTP